MNGLNDLIGMDVEVEISGKTHFSGNLIDVGLDILLLYNGEKYFYIPLLHLHNVREKVMKFNETKLERPMEEMYHLQNENENISYRKVLLNAKGQFIEIYITGNRSIHGYITSVLNDYIVFYSPIYKTLFISLHHLKWITPYTKRLTPYRLSNSDLPVMPSNIPLARSFDDQLKKYEGQLIVFDLGEDADMVGFVKKVSNNLVELIKADGNSIYWRISHIKSVHFP